MRKGESVYLAGFHFFKYNLGNASFTFKTIDNTSICFQLHNLGVLVPTKINKKVLEDVEPIPSIVGNDFLEEQKLALSFNPSQKITYLEEIQTT